MYSLDTPEIRDFLTKWFANGRFEFGLKRYETAENLDEYIAFINKCKMNKEPAFHSVSPRGVVEKLFWEFDAAKKEGNYTYSSASLDEVWEDVMTLYINIKELGAKPLIFYSGNRGFHVWAYVYSTEFPSYPPEWEKEGRELYKLLHTNILGDIDNYKFYDRTPSSVNSMARIPFSYHQKTGNQVIPLTPLRYPYIPLLDDFIAYPLNPEYVITTERQARANIKRRESESLLPKRGLTTSIIRPCILEAMKTAPSHYSRLAFVMDAIYSGLSDEDIHALLKTYTASDDYNYFATQYQLEYQRGRAKEGYRPPTNETLIAWGILKEIPKPKPHPW